MQAAEQQLRIQSAQIGIAEAEMFPHIGINGSIGLAANQFGRLFNSQSGTGTIGPSLSWNILNYGRLLANVRLQNDLYQQFVRQYQQSILNANQDAENALIAYLQVDRTGGALAGERRSATELTDYLLRNFQTGYLAGRCHRYRRVHQPTVHRDQLPGHAAGRGRPGRGQHRPEPDPAVPGDGRRLATPSGGRRPRGQRLRPRGTGARCGESAARQPDAATAGRTGPQTEVLPLPKGIEVPRPGPTRATRES